MTILRIVSIYVKRKKKNHIGQSYRNLINKTNEGEQFSPLNRGQGVHQNINNNIFLIQILK